MAQNILAKSYEETVAVIRPVIDGKLCFARIPIRRRRPEDILDGKVYRSDEMQSRLTAVADWYAGFSEDDENIALYAMIQAYRVPVEYDEYVKILDEEPYVISDIDMSHKAPVIDYLDEYKGLARTYTDETWSPQSRINEVVYMDEARKVLKWLSQYFRLVPKPEVEIEFGEEITDEITEAESERSEGLF